MLAQLPSLGAMLWLGLGAALGAWARWGLSLALNTGGLPLGTLIANVGGGLLMGMALAFFANTSQQDALRLFVMTGFLGGFTTFSAFSAESLQMLQREQYGLAAAHTLSHVLGALLMALLGYMLMVWLKK